ncbi:glutamate--tRNA ligase [bacterium]|nr:glutamate--tRNA ligase [bacterium]
MNSKTADTETRLRFAPSPTGYLHIGSARTAFFNWLYAKKTGGKFILRIEDTDIKRHQEDTISTILDSLKWLEIGWDEGPDVGGDYGPYRQSERLGIYKDYAQKLLEEKKAYRCFCSQEQLREKREEALKINEFYKYDRRCFNLTENEISAKIKSGDKFSIRILIPQNKIISFNDNVYGYIKINSSNVDDFIILRSSGMPTYNFSAAVDDYLMKITHVIRGEDHLYNTPKQLIIYDALGFDYPDFTHLPMILAADGQKLSKRHGSISIESYREEGFLPEAVLNYIALLGWSYDEKTTIFSIDEMTEKFDLKSINKKASRFDYEKLLYLNGYYIRELDENRLEEILIHEITEKNENLRDKSDFLREKLGKIIPVTKKRVRTISDYEKAVLPFFNPVSYSDNTKKYFAKKDFDAKMLLEKSIKSLENLDDSSFTTENIENKLRTISANLGLEFKKVAEVIRIAIWGKPVSPPLFETIEILGSRTTLLRLKNYLDLISQA